MFKIGNLKGNKAGEGEWKKGNGKRGKGKGERKKGKGATGEGVSNHPHETNYKRNGLVRMLPVFFKIATTFESFL